MRTVYLRTAPVLNRKKYDGQKDNRAEKNRDRAERKKKPVQLLSDRRGLRRKKTKFVHGDALMGRDGSPSRPPIYCQCELVGAPGGRALPSRPRTQSVRAQ